MQSNIEQRIMSWPNSLKLSFHEPPNILSYMPNSNWNWYEQKTMPRRELINIFIEMLCVIMEHLESTQFDKLFAVGGKDLVMFYADWCPFCQRFKPLFESAATKSKSSTTSYKMYGAKVNDDDNPLWDRFSINAVPTIIAFDKGNIIARRDAKMSAGLNESDLDSILQEVGI